MNQPALDELLRTSRQLCEKAEALVRQSRETNSAGQARARASGQRLWRTAPQDREQPT